MRDFRDAKTMAQTLRDSLTTKAVSISHSESLELVSRMLGVADWNTLSAKLKTDRHQDRTPAVAKHLDGSASYPAIPIRDFVPFPAMTFPLFVGREKTIQALEVAFERQQDIVLAVQKDLEVDEPGSDDVHEVGLLARPLEVVRLADTTMKVLTQVERRVVIRRFTGESGLFQADITDISEPPILDARDLIEAAVKRFESYATTREMRIHPAARAAIDQSDEPGRIADMISPYLMLPLRDKQTLLRTIDPVARLEQVITLMDSASAPPRSAELVQTLDRALADANRRQHEYATLEHLLLALSDDKDAAAVLRGCGVDLVTLRESLARYVETAFGKLTNGGADAKPTAAFQRVTRGAAMGAWEAGRMAVTGADVLVGLFAEWKSPAMQQLAHHRMTQKDALDFMGRGIVKKRS